jgi:Tol biopolymer transport system component
MSNFFLFTIPRLSASLARQAILFAAVMTGILVASSPSAKVPDEMQSPASRGGELKIVGNAVRFAPGIASTQYAEVRLTLSPDGNTALWFSRDRPGGPGGYDIWISRKTAQGWSAATPAPFNSPGRDFDPAFSADGRYVYFCSDRPGGFGGDDIYRVEVKGSGFGEVENLGATVNSPGNEFAPMLSPDGRTLLFASNRDGGKGGYDLYVARKTERGFAKAESVPGDINTDANEFDATFLADNATIVFARAKDFRTDRVDLFVAAPTNGRYDAGKVLPSSVNGDKDTYGPMLDWSNPQRFSFSAQREGATSMDLYLVDYALIPLREGKSAR